MGGWRNFLLHLQWLFLPVFLCELVFFFFFRVPDLDYLGGAFDHIIQGLYSCLFSMFSVHQTLVFLIW